MNAWTLAVAAVVAGFLLPFQAGANARLSTSLPDRLQAAVVSFAVGLLALVVLALAKAGVPTSVKPGLPWWAWIGGLMGAAYVASAVYIAPRLGVVALLVLGLVGQAAGSILVDHFGLMGLPTREMTPGRIIGLLVVLAGSWLVIRK